MSDYLVLHKVGDTWKIVGKHRKESRAIARLQKIAQPGEHYLIVSVLVYSLPFRGES